MSRLILILTALTASWPVSALEVFACEPEWASLVAEIADASVSITVATTAYQDPHRLQAKPSLIAAARRADLLVCSGADLEIGWLPLLLRRSGNPGIQAGGDGYFLAADHVRKLEVPKIIDRSQGDVHPQGNPHVHLAPRNIKRIASALAERMSTLDASKARDYQSNLDDFLIRWDAAQDSWEEKAEALRGLRVVSYHRSFTYLADWLDLNIVATLEPQPGIPPSGAQLVKLLKQLTPNPPAAVISTPYTNERPAEWLSDRIGIPTVKLPYTVGGTEGADDLFDLYTITLDTLIEVRQ